MRLAAITLIVLALSGCDRRVISKHWEDGNYRAYARPVTEEIIMGHCMGDGAILGLSEPTVIAAGSDSRCVVFRRQSASGGIEHFDIGKKADRAGDVSGPFTADAYKAIATKLTLPEFSWHLEQP